MGRHETANRRDPVAPLEKRRARRRRRACVPTTAPDTAQRLAELKREVALESEQRLAAARRKPPAVPPQKKNGSPGNPPTISLGVAALVVLPFVVLVRGAVTLYLGSGWPAILAIVASAAVTLAIVALYAAWLCRALTGRARVRTMAQWVALPLLIGYCGHALFYLSRVNAKTDAVRAEYRHTHPLLRLALATLVLGNRDLLVTDLSRVPSDYPQMGLPVFDGTLHRLQADGWAHAVDLRTIGRSGVTNLLVAWYFRAMGFRILRHVGTADHLHVELPVR